MEPDLYKTHYCFNHCKNTILFVDDQVIIADSVDSLLRGVFTLQIQQNIYEWKYRQKKSEPMPLLQHQAKGKIIVDQKYLHVTSFRQLCS